MCVVVVVVAVVVVVVFLSVKDVRSKISRLLLKLCHLVIYNCKLQSLSRLDTLIVTVILSIPVTGPQLAYYIYIIMYM